MRFKDYFKGMLSLSAPKVEAVVRLHTHMLRSGEECQINYRKKNNKFLPIIRDRLQNTPSHE